MPKVAQYQPDQVLTNVADQPQANASAANVFQSNIQLAQSAENLVKASVDMRQRIDTTSAEESLLMFEREKNKLFFDPDNGYFNTQGRNAYDSVDSVSKTLKDLKRQYGESLSPNARLMFDKAADVHITRGKVDIDRHAAKGLKAWEIATIKAQVENSIENASLHWNQPDKLKVQNALGRQAVIDSAEQEGIGAEATNERLQTFNSSFAKTVIESAIDSNSQNGRETYDKYSDDLESPDRERLQNKIEKKEQAEKTQAIAQQAILTGARLADTYDNREELRNEINKINDPDLRKHVTKEAMRQFDLKRKAQDEARADVFERAESHIIEGGSAETFKLEDPEGWNSLSTRQKHNIESGKAVITDWNTYSSLVTLPKEELAKVNPVDHFSELAPAERNKLISAVKSANGTASKSQRIDHQVGRTRNSQTSMALEQMLGKKSTWSDKKRGQANAFYSLLDEEVAFREDQKGGQLSSEEFTKVLSDLTREVTIERSLFGVDFLAPDVEQSIIDIPSEDVLALSQYLRDNGIPVNIDNLTRAYRQATQ